MGDLFRIKQAGDIRWSFPIVVDSTTYAPGNVMEIVSTSNVAQAQLGSGTTTRTWGFAIDPDPRDSGTRVSSGGSINRTDGTPSGDMVSLLFGEAVIENDELTSGIVFAINDKIYQDGSGNLTTNNSNAKELGRALSTAVANAGDALLMLARIHQEQE